MSDSTHGVIVTGASGGLGRAFAAALAARASGMVLAGRDGVRLATLAADLRARHPRLVVRAVSGDLTDRDARDAVLHAGATLGTQVDLLVNAAGINEFAAFDAQSPQAIERLICVDLLVPMQLTQLVLPLLASARRAQVINVGSIFGYIGYPGFAAYCAAKFGLRGFSQALRRELADTCVEVRYFAPRATRTPLITTAIAAMNRELNNREDTAERVAQALVRFIDGSRWERKIGFPERLYVFLNQLVPALNDRAIRGKLAVVRRHLGAAAHAKERSQ